MKNTAHVLPFASETYPSGFVYARNIVEGDVLFTPGRVVRVVSNTRTNGVRVSESPTYLQVMVVADVTGGPTFSLVRGETEVMEVQGAAVRYTHTLKSEYAYPSGDK